jgi:tetratricopeptide (TPR) repeat protein
VILQRHVLVEFRLHGVESLVAQQPVAHVDVSGVVPAMARPRRNEPCHCGSGQKYKRCCLAKDESAIAESRAARAALHPSTPEADHSSLLRLPDVPASIAEELDAASNLPLQLIHAGKLDEAEAAARHLLDRFPDLHDGYDRLGMVHEARGDRKQAAACYRKVVDLVRQHPDGYSSEFVKLFQKQADELDPPPA